MRMPGRTPRRCPDRLASGCRDIAPPPGLSGVATRFGPGVTNPHHALGTAVQLRPHNRPCPHHRAGLPCSWAVQNYWPRHFVSQPPHGPPEVLSKAYPPGHGSQPAGGLAEDRIFSNGCIWGGGGRGVSASLEKSRETVPVFAIIFGDHFRPFFLKQVFFNPRIHGVMVLLLQSFFFLPPFGF